MFEVISYVSSFFLGLYFSTFSSVERKPTQCGEEANLEYCHYEGSSGSSRVVYFFHGFGNNVEAWGWNPVTKRIEAEWAKNFTDRPHVVSVSFGKLWWYTSKEQGEAITKFMQIFEAGLGLARIERVLYGDSMGGHNAYRFAHDYPLLFKKLALICPAVPVSFVDGVQSAGVWPFYSVAGNVIQELYDGAKITNPLKNPLYWKEFNRISAVHLILSKEDHFGFYPGGMKVAEILKTNPDSSFSMEEQDVFHCNVEAQKLALFLGE